MNNNNIKDDTTVNECLDRMMTPAKLVRCSKTIFYVVYHERYFTLYNHSSTDKDAKELLKKLFFPQHSHSALLLRYRIRTGGGHVRG